MTSGRQRAGGFPQSRWEEADGRGARPAHRRRSPSRRLRARPAHPRLPADTPSSSARGGARGGRLREGMGARYAAVGSRRARSIRAARVRAGAASRLRAQPSLLRPGGRRHGAAVPGSARPRRHPRSERGAAAPGVGAARHDDERDLTDAYAPLKRAADQGRVKLLDLGVSHNADGLWFNLKPGAFAADARGAWLQRDELRRAISMAVNRKVFADTVFLGAGVPVFGAETPANKKWYWTDIRDSPRSRGRHAGARVDRAERPQRRRHARGRARPAGTLHAADAAGPAEPRAGGGGHPRRIEEDRPERGRRDARRGGGHRSIPERAIRRGVLQRRQDRSGSRPPTPTSGSAPEARTRGISSRRRRRPPGSGASTS